MVNELALLPDDFKREKVLELFSEFGITNYNENGSWLQHRCTLPFGGHTDHTSLSAGVNFRNFSFSCFVCGHHGGLMWWIAANKGLETAASARDWFQAKTGLGGRETSLSTQLKILEAIQKGSQDQSEEMPFYHDKILGKWSWQIQHPYLTEIRGIPEDNLNKYEVGYDDGDLYTERIIIPLRWKGNLVGWQARKLPYSNDTNDQKYLNSPATPRDRILYGEVKNKEIVLVESPMSVLRHCHHLPIVATMGVKITSDQLALLHKYRKITLCYDNDKAGMQATEFLRQKLSRYTEVLVAPNPYASVDPAEIGDKDMERIVSGSIPQAIWQPPRLESLTPYQEAA